MPSPPPFDLQGLGPTSRIFGLWHPSLKDSKFFFRKAEIDEILMKIVEIEVLFSISGYISLFLDYYTDMDGRKILGVGGGEHFSIKN